MKVLVIGSGAREHAICWRLRHSKKLSKLFCAPGNPGIGKVAENIPIPVDDIPRLLNFVKEKGIDLTIVGPEYPLTLGIVDEFKKAGARIFGPSKDAARIEGSKSFAKEIMIGGGIPTAGYEVVHNREDALRVVEKFGVPLVLKADGLASGKGVFVCHTMAEVTSGLSALYSFKSDARVVIEEFLEGVEVSYIVATDGENIVPMATSHDYKRINDDDEGPNTGGMGSVCPSPRLGADEEEEVIFKVILPTLTEMRRRGFPFSGFLYAGLMKSPDGRIKVLEFNARFGDPECQSVMRRLDSDFLEILLLLTEPGEDGKKHRDLPRYQWKKGSAVTVVLASEGYPDAPKTGDEITGIELAEMMPDVVVFHAGTTLNEKGKLVTSGGRVLSVSATADTLDEARTKAFKATDMIQFRGRHIRRDIGR